MHQTKVSKEEIEEFLRNACSEEILKSINILEGGYANTNYLLKLSNSRNVVLKIWNGKEVKEVEKLVSETCWLASKGVPTPLPLSVMGTEKLILKDGLAWTLYPYIDGNWLGYEDVSLYSMGRAMAMLHLVEAPQGLKEDFDLGPPLFRKMFQIAEDTNCWPPFLCKLKSNIEALDKLIPEDLPKGVIHGDWFSDNILGDKEGEVLAILDLEHIHLGYLAFDLVIGFIGFGWENEQPISARWETILAGYQSVRGLTENEKNALPNLHHYAILCYAAWHYHDCFMKMKNHGIDNGRYNLFMDRLNKKLPF